MKLPILLILSTASGGYPPGSGISLRRLGTCGTSVLHIFEQEREKGYLAFSCQRLRVTTVVDKNYPLFNLALQVFQLFNSLPNMDASHITAIEPQSFQTVSGRSLSISSSRRKSPDTGPTESIGLRPRPPLKRCLRVRTHPRAASASRC